MSPERGVGPPDGRPRPMIAVIGGQHPPPEALAMAEEVGYRIASGGGVLICGGLEGVMEAACRGAKRGGGITVGLLPTGSKATANPYVDIPIATALGTARNVVLARTADALIAVDGSYGTLSEMSHAFERGKPVVGLHTWDMASLGVPPELFIPVATPQEAVEKALEIARRPFRESLPF